MKTNVAFKDEKMSTPITPPWRVPAKDLRRQSLARPKSCAHSWMGLAPQKSNGLSQKVQSKDAGQEGTMDSILVLEISPEQQRIGGNNMLLNIKDDDNYNTYQFLRTY